MESAFRESVAQVGRLNLLVQTLTREHEHLKEATPEYAALLRAMVAWITKGERPTSATLQTSCEAARAAYGEDCHFDPDFAPKPLSTRVYRKTCSQELRGIRRRRA